MDAYKLLIEAADFMRASKLEGEKAFEHLTRSAEELAVAMTDVRIFGRLDPELAKELEELLGKLI